ncbi:hypothetical protein IQ249_05405 [Lusitaniella coriacea LEGE 07157]|uniref:Phosphoenolpyruvate synthase n=1 Tax=Lusitaniella coriacea LEGE 07157 TaxID=945747 RepID=A0A8J7AXE0_9CYAN|nr:putative PEP-binding protein [Lusitaniella coriacea]MBE9115332.1 hypothetical protein [Lusitaniella coriacea LEGE 07157]
MKSLRWLSQIQPSEFARVGGKACALAYIKQQGYPVLPGFAIPTPTFREFLKILGQVDPLLSDLSDSSLHVDINDYKALQIVARRVRLGIAKTEFPKEWRESFFAAAEQLQSATLIVRPSLALPLAREQDFSGLMRSRACWCQPQALETTLKQVWAELFRANCLFYWLRQGLRLKAIDLALLVQPLPEAIASGRIERNAQGTSIFAARGLGQSWVRGEVRPDCYSIQESTGSVETQQLGNQPLAYGLKEPIPPTLKDSGDRAIDPNCLETHPLSDERPQQAVLDPDALSELIALVQNLIAKHSTICYIEWAYVRDAAQSQGDLPKGSRRFFLVQISSYRKSVASLNPMPEPLPLGSKPKTFSLKGISASPGSAIAPAQVIHTATQPFPIVPSGRILVTPTVTPEWLPLLQKAAGVVTEQGGMTSHAAILARELSIPALVGVSGATEAIESGESLFIDGIRGEIRRARPGETLSAKLSPDSESFVPIATQILVNLSQPSRAAQAAALPVDGIGLIRSELTILSLLNSQSLSEWVQPQNKTRSVEQLSDCVVEFARQFFPRPVFYRSTDWRLPEFPPFSSPEPSSPAASNPLLGRRGTLNYRLDPTLFDLELEALVRVQNAGYRNVNLMLPFVRSPQEFVFCRDRAQKMGLMSHEAFEIWIMAEVPSVYFLLPEYVRAGVRGISLGTNDLAQLLLGVERGQEEWAQDFDERNPAVLGAIAQLIERAKSLDIPCSICGQAPVLYPEIIDRLVEWGMTAISVEPDAVPQTRRAIARAERRLLLKTIQRKPEQ